MFIPSKNGINRYWPIPISELTLDITSIINMCEFWTLIHHEMIHDVHGCWWQAKLRRININYWCWYWTKQKMIIMGKIYPTNMTWTTSHKSRSGWEPAVISVDTSPTCGGKALCFPYISTINGYMSTIDG
jgi:hypothetical protein